MENEEDWQIWRIKNIARDLEISLNREGLHQLAEALLSAAKKKRPGGTMRDSGVIELQRGQHRF
ncbi:MAG TPA: hypothetical protein VI957_03410 [Candidatus Paceibacterota bacterium]